MVWIIGEYAERIDNADELLEAFLETFPEETAMVRGPSCPPRPHLRAVQNLCMASTGLAARDPALHRRIGMSCCAPCPKM
jgi:hypothetical protein